MFVYIRKTHRRVCFKLDMGTPPAGWHQHSSASTSCHFSSTVNTHSLASTPSLWVHSSTGRLNIPAGWRLARWRAMMTHCLRSTCSERRSHRRGDGKEGWEWREEGHMHHSSIKFYTHIQRFYIAYLTGILSSFVVFPLYYFPLFKSSSSTKPSLISFFFFYVPAKARHETGQNRAVESRHWKQKQYWVTGVRIRGDTNWETCNQQTEWELGWCVVSPQPWGITQQNCCALPVHTTQV